MMPLKIFLLITNLVQFISAFGSGAPTSACDTLLPVHGGGIPPQTSPSLYKLSLDANKVEQGLTVHIVIESNPPEIDFGGFMIQAKTTSPPYQIVGQFIPFEETVKIISCNEGINNTATQSNKKDKKTVDLKWKAPTDFIGSVIFNATVLKEYSTFWAGVVSPIIEVIEGTGTTLPDISTTIQPSTNETEDSIYEGCGATKGCFGFPDGCISKKTCHAIAVIHVRGEQYQFELKTGFPGNEKLPAYVALGLSSDIKMGDDSVMECVAENGIVNAYTSYTTRSPFASDRTGISQNIIKLIESSYSEGTIHCKFERQTISTVHEKIYDLVNDKYHLLIAIGERLKENSVGSHNLGELASGNLQHLSETAEFKGASVLLLRLHGSLMIISWIGTTSLGVLFARYFKKTWVGGQICGKDHWFALHRFFMIVTWTLTMIAFVIIFIEIDGWSDVDNPHAILGVITTAICFVQPIGAHFRPAPNTAARLYFNWGHLLGGNLAHVFAITTMFYAVKLTKAELPEWVNWILALFVAFYVFMHFVFSIVGRASDNYKPNFNEKSKSIEAMESDHKKDTPYSKLRKCLLIFNIIVIVLFVVGLVLIVVLSPIGDTLEKYNSKVLF